MMRWSWPAVVLFLGVIAAGTFTSPKLSSADDWPMWRAQEGRQASTDEQLSGDLSLHWYRDLGQQQPAWLEDSRLQFDAIYQPVVAGKTMVVASSNSDSVSAFDTESGKTLWKSFVGGPVRFAPALTNGKVLFGADDGFFYCLDLKSGEQLWKYDARLSDRKVLGNSRLISLWPIRTGCVVHNDKVFFTAGIWPEEGTFLYALDVETGGPVPVLSTTDRSSVTSNSNVLVLKDKAPHGYLAVTNDKLLIPCGRAVAACLDLKTGKYISMSYDTKLSSYHVVTSGDWIFHGYNSYNITQRNRMPIEALEPVLTDDACYFANGSKLQAVSLKDIKTATVKDRRGREVKRLVANQLWETTDADIRNVPEGQKYADWIKTHPVQFEVKAGSQLFGFQGNTIFSLDLPQGDRGAKISWKHEMSEAPSTLLAADGKLFVVTDKGKIFCFGASSKAPESVTPDIVIKEEFESTQEALPADVQKLFEKFAHQTGYALVLGIEKGELVEQLLRRTELTIVAVDEDPETIEALRRKADSYGFYGNRVVGIVADPLECGLPPYIARLITSEDIEAFSSKSVEFACQQVFYSQRPYGGVAAFKTTDDQHQAIEKAVADTQLANAKVDRVAGITTITREGELPGSANWTHEYGDPSNSLMSMDELVMAPLGVLWFGGPSADDSLYFDRHEWPPSMHVLDGRMFLQGPGVLTAVDVYTGQILWKRDLAKAVSPGRRGNFAFTGMHSVAVHDSLYLTLPDVCLRIDPATGKTLDEFRLEDKEDSWGRIRVYENLLIVSVFRELPGLKQQPVEVRAIDRFTGDTKWAVQADLTFPVVSIGQGRIYAFDGALSDFYRDMKRKGLVPKAQEAKFVTSIDVATGKVLWKKPTDVAVTWLGFSEKSDVLMASNKNGMVAMNGADGKELWRKGVVGKGFSGHPESVWDKVIVTGDQVIDQRGPGLAYDVKTGEAIMRTNPLTGESIEWQFTKSGHHCNYAIANPHMVTFRAASAGFADIETGETSRMVGFRSGCRNSLIPANGVLNAPNYASGCTCGYSLFTSLAFVHMPEMERWTYNALKFDTKKETLNQVGINFGAPGDRIADNGTMWLDFPSVGGSSPKIPLSVTGIASTFSNHSSRIDGEGLSWVSASGIEGEAAIRISLGAVVNEGAAKSKSETFTVRLHFSEPDASVKKGDRVFDVSLQGKPVMEGFDVLGTTNAALKSIVKEFNQVEVGNELVIQLSKKGSRLPILCGVELVRE